MNGICEAVFVSEFLLKEFAEDIKVLFPVDVPKCATFCAVFTFAGVGHDVDGISDVHVHSGPSKGDDMSYCARMMPELLTILSPPQSVYHAAWTNDQQRCPGSQMTVLTRAL